jgi:hypothetical protein
MIRAASVADGDGAPRIYNKLNADPNLRVVKDGAAGKVTAIFHAKRIRAVPGIRWRLEPQCHCYSTTPSM